MKHKYLKFLKTLLVPLLVLIHSTALYGQTPSTMDFGNSFANLASGDNPMVNQTASPLLNNFNVSTVASNTSILFVAPSSYGFSGASLNWNVNAIDRVIASGTLSTSNGGEVGLTSVKFAFRDASSPLAKSITFTGKRDGATVGTLVQVVQFESGTAIDFTAPTSGSFATIDELVITPENNVRGNMAIDDLVVIESTPVVANVRVLANGANIAGANLDFAVNFNENVTVDNSGGSPQLAVIVGATTRQAFYVNGSGTNTLIFRYVVQCDDEDTDGITLGNLNLNGSTIRNSAARNAVLTLNSVEVSTDVLVSQTPVVTIDAPTSFGVCDGIQSGLNGGSPLAGSATKWVLSEITFQDGGALNGSFTYNATTGVYSDLIINATGPPGFLENIYGTFAYNQLNTQIRSESTSSQLVLFYNFRNLVLSFNTPLNAAGGVVQLTSVVEITSGFQPRNVNSTGNVVTGTAVSTTGVYSGTGVTDGGDGTYSFNPATAGIGIHTISYTYTNTLGCPITATDTIEVLDDSTPPVADVAALADVTAQCTVTTLTAPTATDNCSGSVTVTNNASLPITAQGTTVVTWTYVDGNGNLSTQTQNVVIDDVTPPTFTVNRATGTMSNPFKSADKAALTSVPSGVYFFNFNNATFQGVLDNDTNGGGWLMVLNYVHQQNTNPDLVIRNTDLPLMGSSVLGDNEAATATWGHMGNALAQAIDFDEIRFYGQSSGHTRIIDFSTSLTTAIDYVKNGTGSFSGINNSANYTLSNIHTSSIPQNAPNFFTNEGDLALTNFPFWRSGQAHWGIKGFGNRWEVDDFPDNFSLSTIHRVWVRANTTPFSDSITVQLDATGSASVSTTDFSINGTDNCGTVTNSLSQSTFDCSNLGDNIIQYTIADSNGNNTVVNVNVTIEDNLAPVPDVAMLADITADNEITVLTAPTATDNCAGSVTVTNDVTLPIVTVGTTVVTWTYSDGNGNITTQVQNVIITDTVAPVITCPANISQNTPVAVTYTYPTAVDLGIAITPELGMTYLGFSGGKNLYISNASFSGPAAFADAQSRGGSVVTITDAIMNSFIATQMVVQGVSEAHIGYSDTLSEGTFVWQDGSNATYTNWQPGEPNDFLGAEDYTFIRFDALWNDVPTGGTATAPYIFQSTEGAIIQTAGLVSGSVFPLGSTTNTFEAIDASGNVSTCSFDVIIIDNTVPDPDVNMLVDIVAQCSVSALTAPTATDDFAGAISATTTVALPITAQGTTVVNWTYDDGNGNTSTQTQNVVITDTTAPVANLATLAAVTAQCAVTTLTAPTATDNCAGMITATTTVALPITAQGTTVVNWTYDDGNGNTSTQTQNIVITDTTAPVANLATLAAVTAQCAVTTLTAPTATDNCAGTITATTTVVLPITAQGTTVVNWTYDDGNGNTSTQTQNVVIIDTTAPVTNLATLTTVTAQCEVTTLTAPTATDNCTGIITGTTTTTFPITASTVVTWTYNDGNGNSSTQTQNVTVTPSDVLNATMANQTFTYDGNAQSLVVTNIPTTATVVYTNNNQTNAGIYQVTATITSANALCTPVVLTATLTIDRAPQTITFTAIADRNLFRDTDFQLNATSSASLPVVYSYAFTGVEAAAVTATGFVTLLDEGFITITASQPGTNNYLPAVSVDQDLLVFLATSARLDGITIDSNFTANPPASIYYLIECNDSTDFIDVQLQNNDAATFSPQQSFRIETPRPGIYRQAVVVVSEDGRNSQNYEIVVERRFQFDAIVEQKYNNVLVVNNNPNNNGGYNFVAYEWFKNGTMVGTEQFFSEGNNATDVLDPTALYYVRMTTTTGEVLQTCESTISLGNTFSLTVLENPVISGRNLNVRADYPTSELDNARYELYSASGQYLYTVGVDGVDTAIQLSESLPVGLYRLVLVTQARSQSVNFIKN